MNQRLNISEKGNELEVTILSYRDKLKTTLLMIWLGFWLACGVVSFGELIHSSGGENRIFWLVFESFWAYFLYAVTKALVWRLKGFESILLDKEGLKYARRIFGKEPYKTYNLSEISKFQKASLDSNALFSVYENAYWFVGGESIAFMVNGKEMRLGTQLNEKELKDLLSKLKFFHQHLVKG